MYIKIYKITKSNLQSTSAADLVKTDRDCGNVLLCWMCYKKVETFMFMFLMIFDVYGVYGARYRRSGMKVKTSETRVRR